MAELTYENQGTNTYLVYELKESEELDSMGIGMLTNNHIPGLAQTVFIQMDNKKYIKYNVSAKITLSNFFSGIINRKRLLGVLDGIVKAMISAEEYMIDPRWIMFDLNYIFTDVTTCETLMIALPLVEMEGKEIDSSAFFRDTIFSISQKIDQTENCDYYMKLIGYLNMNKNLTWPGFKQFLDELSGKQGGPSNPPASEDMPYRQDPMRTTTGSPETVKGNGDTPGQSNWQAPYVATADPAPNSSGKLQPHGDMAAGGYGGRAASESTMAIPGKNGAVSKVPASNADSTAGAGGAEPTQEMSLFYLLNHYSKENAAAYRAQKAAKEEKKEQGKQKKESKKKKEKARAAYAIPGQAGESIETPSGRDTLRTPGQSGGTQAGFSGGGDAAHTYGQSQGTDSMRGTGNTPQPNRNYGATTTLKKNKAGATTVLKKKPNASGPVLIRLKTSERIPIQKSPFNIGRDPEFADYCISDNTAVGRSHAMITVREGQCFVLDSNSINHTYINGEMIPSSAEVPIHEGDRLSFADEDFEFRIH
ncbi:MAG: FHA domain-containing protein [Lachnospiraceae bacterium]|nr:FHA domain-containing protein [Lachnospiraceae bacterium]